MRVETELHEVDGPAQMRALAEMAASKGVSRLIAAGGDGTVHGALNGIAGRLDRVELAILPVGTGNDLARAVHVPLDDMDAALTLALHGPARRVDVVRLRGRAESRLFVNMCYGGFGGCVAKELDPEAKARWGLAAYWLTLAKRLLYLPEHRVRIRADGHAFSSTLHGLLIANSRYLGGGVPAAPHARLDDGRFDVALVPARSVWDALAASIALLAGSLDSSTHVMTFQARSLSVQSEPEMEFTADGEAAPAGPLDFQVLPGALRLVTGVAEPAEASAGRAATS